MISHSHRYCKGYVDGKWVDELCTCGASVINLKSELTGIKALCKTVADTLRNHRVPQTIAEAGLQVLVTLGPLIEQLDKASNGAQLIGHKQLLECNQKLMAQNGELMIKLDHANKRWCETVPGYFVCSNCNEVCVEAVGKYEGMCEECYDERCE